MARKVTAPAPEGRVNIELPRGSSQDAFIAVNGVSYIVPRKGTHAVPPEIAEEFYRSLQAEDEREDNSAAMRDTGKARQV